MSLVMVLGSCVSLGMDSPQLADTSPQKRALWFSDNIFATFFSAECLVKVSTARRRPWWLVRRSYLAS